MEIFNSAFGDFQLERIPLIPRDTLRAWDAADELLLNHLKEQCLPTKESKILLVNDQFGALACALSEFNTQSWSDSFIAHLAIEHNFSLNQLPAEQQAIQVPSTQAPEGPIDIALIKVPKTLALLEEQLKQLKPLLKADSIIIGTAMVKHLPGSAIQLFEDILGSTHTSLAKKKARLILSTPDKDNADSLVPSYPKSFYEKSLDLQLSNHANVFSKEKLDIGARFILEQFDRLPSASNIIDLGCGNGVLGIMAQRHLSEAHIHFVDESYMAVASAQDNYEAAYSSPQASYWNSDCLSQVDIDSPDLILCNPPFHQQHSVGDHIAWKMLKQSYQTLAKGGTFWLVGNRHLGYHVKMKKLFGNCTQVAANKKFVVLSSQKT